LRVICLRKAEAAELAEHGVSEWNIRLVSIGVNVEEFKPSAKYMLWMRKFIPEKGARYLIETASILISDGSFCEFCHLEDLVFIH